MKTIFNLIFGNCKIRNWWPEFTVLFSLAQNTYPFFSEIKISLACTWEYVTVTPAHT